MRNLDSSEPEKYVLSGILNNSKTFHSVASIINENDFFSEKHRILFTAMRKLSDDGVVIEIGSVDAKLRMMGEINSFLNSDGKQEYLFQIFENYPCYSDVEFYARQVKDFSTLRQLQVYCNKIQSMISEPAGDAAEIMAKAGDDLYKLRQRGEKKRLERADEVVARLINEIQNSNNFKGLPTGYPGLDSLTFGLRQGEMLVLAAQSGVGKTAFALNIASFIAFAGKSVLFFCMEMRNTALMTRVICSRAKINSGQFRKFSLNTADVMYLQNMVPEINSLNLWLSDSAGITIGEIRQKCLERKCSKEGLDFVVIDYLQLIRIEKAENRTVGITDISWQIKNLAMDLEIPILCLSQTNREMIKDKGKPGLHHLRDSGSIGQDADGVWFITRDGMEATLHVVKNRQYMTGEIPLEYIGEYFLFEEAKPKPVADKDGFFL